MPRTLISSRLKAEERSTEKQYNHIEAALFAIEIIQSLLFKSSVRHRLDSITFQTILSEFRQWAHFSSSIYSAIRKTEIALLTQVTRLAIEPHCLLERLSPWGYDDDDDDDDDDENQRKLTVTLV